ncbi:hypothetical protein APY04_0127 [Hyphomicrobium sulfonivorans]|uniref:Uncharacterized protein n=1 Tax=Hyphomicrobium sulfonivorans TaxID=121290 RepID=A0A109BP22_HYPSL|nr:hypothetical protein APY04_0127 [Hyphomicrobium sulfonivorans]
MGWLFWVRFRLPIASPSVLVAAGAISSTNYSEGGLITVIFVSGGADAYHCHPEAGGYA